MEGGARGRPEGYRAGTVVASGSLVSGCYWGSREVWINRLETCPKHQWHGGSLLAAGQFRRCRAPIPTSAGDLRKDCRNKRSKRRDGAQQPGDLTPAPE